MPERPFITCHVLNTTTGKPAADIAVKLNLVKPSTSHSEQWTATTNSDGRVAAWTASNSSESHEVNSVVASTKSQLRDEEEMVWSLTFSTQAYFGEGKTFWPEVQLIIAAKKSEEHYHVPLLLGPWSYTTYRGS